MALPRVRRRDGDLRTVHRRRGAPPLSSDQAPATTMTCSLTSRILLTRLRQPVKTARLMCDRTAAYGAILQKRLLVPGCRPSVLIPPTPANQQRNSKPITP